MMTKYYAVPFIKHQLFLRNITQNKFAKQFGIETSYIHRVINYRTVGELTRIGIAKKLGFENWDKLEVAATEWGDTEEGQSKVFAHWGVETKYELKELVQKTNADTIKIAKKRKIMANFIKSLLRTQTQKIGEIAQGLETTRTYVWSIFHYVNIGTSVREHLAGQFGYKSWRELEKTAKEWADQNIPSLIGKITCTEEFASSLSTMNDAEFIQLLEQGYPIDYSKDNEEGKIDVEKVGLLLKESAKRLFHKG